MKNIYYLLLFSLITWTNYASAQQLELQWSKSTGGPGWDWVNTVQPDEKGNYYIAGGVAGNFVNDTLKSNPNENSHAFIAKYDTSGTVVWQKSFGGKLFSNVSDMALSGDFVLVCGMFQDTLKFAGTSIVSNSFTNGYLACLSLDGSLVWLKAISDKSQLSNIVITASPDDRVFIAGVYKDTLVLDQKILASVGKSSIFLAMVDPLGNFINPISLTGGENISQPVLACNNQMLCIGGSFSDSLQIMDTTVYAAAKNDFFLAGFNMNQKFKWCLSGGGSGEDRVSGITMLKNGNIAALGNFEQTILLGNQIKTSNGYSDLFISCLDSTGNWKWVKTFGGIADDYGHSIAGGIDGNLYMAGSFRRGIILGYGADKLNSEEYKNLSGFGNAFIAKFNKHGDLKSSTYLPGSSEDYCKSLLVDKFACVIATGNFFNTIELSGHTDGVSSTHTAGGDKDIFIARFTDRCLKFRFDMGNDTTMCSGVPIVLKVPLNFDTYQWGKDGSTGQTFVADKPGTYAVTVTNMYGCQATDSLLVTLHAIPIANAGNDTTMQADHEVKISGATVFNSESIQWSSLGTGIFEDPSLINPVYLPSPGDIKGREISIVLSAENKCIVARDTLVLRLFLGDEDIVAYPNPTTTTVNIMSNIEDLTSLDLADSHGTTLLHKKLESTMIYSLNLEAYPVGTYQIRVTTKRKVKILSVTKLHH